MVLTADEVTSNDIAGPVMVIVLFIAGTIFVLGYRWAVMHRANFDYKKTKESLPGMRKTFWLTWWATTKIGFWVALVLFCLLMWWIRGDKDDADPVTPHPSPSLVGTRH